MKKSPECIQCLFQKGGPCDTCKIRYRISYRFWFEELRWYLSRGHNPNLVGDALRHIHLTLDSRWVYRRANTARFSEESLKLLLKDYKALSIEGIEAILVRQEWWP